MPKIARTSVALPPDVEAWAEVSTHSFVRLRLLGYYLHRPSSMAEAGRVLEIDQSQVSRHTGALLQHEVVRVVRPQMGSVGGIYEGDWARIRHLQRCAVVYLDGGWKTSWGPQLEWERHRRVPVGTI